MGGDQSGCERRIEVFVKIQQKKNLEGGSGGGGVGGGAVRVDMNEELTFFGKIQKKNLEGGSGGGGGGPGDGGDQSGCERRIEVFVKIQQKKNLEGGGSGWGRSGWM